MRQDGVQKMVKKLSRGQKAWLTRKANLKAMENKKPIKVSENLTDKTLRIRLPSDFTVIDGPALKALTLCGQLEDAIMLLETRISNATAKINSLI